MNINIIKNKKGFTLIELIIVIVIIGILSLVSVPIYRKYIAEAAMTEGYTLVGAVARAEIIYANTKGGGKFLKGFYLTPSYSAARELGLVMNGQYNYFCQLYVGNNGVVNGKDSIYISAYGCANGMENYRQTGVADSISVYTTVYSDGRILDFRESYSDY